MNSEYLITFSSFYKAAYARDLLYEIGYHSMVVKAPPELMQSCGYGLTLGSTNIQQILSSLHNVEISYRSVFLIEIVSGRPKYKKIR